MNDMDAKIVSGKLHISGFVYYKVRSSPGRTYWQCRLGKAKECSARAVMNNFDTPENIVVFKGPADSPHEHPPNVDNTAAEEVTSWLKRAAADNPQLPPSQILRTHLAALQPGVLAQLPE